jgi:hypothetical protein
MTRGRYTEIRNFSFYPELVKALLELEFNELREFRDRENMNILHIIKITELYRNFKEILKLRERVITGIS